ncbi:hypothetical protein [Pseudanabaena sp. 'Roaring Creek']|uniref:hypothetical protein n=1 Tax=Pseudanabaena sp. 'Roaring Creek' TaxID=1681830 RepID=UPI0006D77423|nr:hypothetical protein [Pseudanabaena sp. 'Roaring Creek']
MKSSIFDQGLNKLNKLNRNGILVLSIIVLLGLIHLSFPFSGDQALFTVGASKINQGGVLYRDFWDLKQPGIYWFYFLAGKFFGFNEIGIHTFEILYFLMFSIVLSNTLKHYYKYSITSSFVPILTVGIYYASAGAWHLTQLEALVGFPIFLTIWFIYQSSKSEIYDNKLLFLSGFTAGIVLLFKLLFLPIVLSFWAVAILDAVTRKKQIFINVLLNIVIPISIGISIPLLISIFYFARLDVLNLLYQTYIEYPPRILREIPHAEVGRLFQGIRWFVTRYASIVLLGSIGIYVLERV